jgi:hypothetical protein
LAASVEVEGKCVEPVGKGTPVLGFEWFGIVGHQLDATDGQLFGGRGANWAINADATPH